MDNNHALRRALRIERATVKLYKQRLRELMAPAAYHRFLEFCRAEVHVGYADSNSADIDQRSEGDALN